MTMRFRNRASEPRLTREEAERQGRATRLAIEAFAQPGTAVSFLNTHHPHLQGRPIDLAVASAEGLLAVEQVIAMHKDGQKRDEMSGR